MDVAYVYYSYLSESTGLLKAALIAWNPTDIITIRNAVTIPAENPSKLIGAYVVLEKSPEYDLNLTEKHNIFI